MKTPRNRKTISGVVSAIFPVKIRPASALAETFREGYTLAYLKDDITAGMIVGVVALPLSMALAIASGVPPQHGLYTAIVAGAIIALLGGSRVQVSGPTAAFIVILAPITAKFGLAGLALSSAMAGIMLVAMGAAGLGRFIAVIPYPVTTGFTAGIAVVIAVLQIKDFFGLSIEKMPDHFPGKISAIFSAMPTISSADLAVGAVTFAILVFWSRWFRKVPAPLVALLAAALLAILMEKVFPGLNIATIQDRFATAENPTGIPGLLPSFGLPWSFHAPGDPPFELTFGLFRELIPSAFTIAMLGAIESLLSAVVSDAMNKTTHDPNAELIGQGVGNIVAPFFGGIAATGAIARTATSLKFGARSPIASFTHAIFVLAAMIVLSPYLGYLPMAALAALLLRVAWHMSEARHFFHTVKVAPRSDVAVLLACFSLTVVFDMVISVSVGVLLAAVLFIRRMSEVTEVKLVSNGHTSASERMPEGVLLYEIAGPLFFGAAQKAMSTLGTIKQGVKVVIMDLRDVPAMDMTGLVNLESAIERLEQQGISVILAGVKRQPLGVMARGHLERNRKLLTVTRSFEVAVAKARAIAMGQDVSRSR